MPEKKSSNQDNWFGIRKELGSGRRTLLTVCSFCLPLLAWVIVSYVPFIWNPDIKLQVSADRKGVTTEFTAGDRVSKDFFPTFAEAIREEIRAILDARKKKQPLSGSRRDNIKKLRHLAPLGVANGWLENNQRQDDEKLFELWKGLAEGSLTSSAITLSTENLDIIKNNKDFFDQSLDEIKLLRLLKAGAASL